MDSDGVKRIYLPKANLNLKRSLLDYLFFFLPKKPRPDFTHEPIEIKEFFWYDSFFKEYLRTEEPIFSNIDPIDVLRNNWFFCIKDYQIIASLEFTRRYPRHEYSKRIRKMYGYGLKRMLSYVTGAKEIRVITRWGVSRVHAEE